MTALALSLLAVLAAPEPAVVRAAVERHLAAHRADVLRELVQLLAIPNIASDTPNIRRNADHLVGILQRRGFATRLLGHGTAPPAVYAELRTPGAARTVLFYAHYDGQPVQAAEWTSPPWQPTLLDRAREDGGREIPTAGSLPDEARVYARSASDDKAPIVAILAALDALQAAGIAPRVNVKLFLEGEEEAGSPHLRSLLEAHRDLLRADVWLLCDGPVHQSRRMQVYFGARGITDLELTVYGPVRALHSGHYGNWAPNPGLELARLLAGMRDDEGRVRIAGFGDDVRPPTEAERRAIAESPAVDEDLRKAFALGRTLGGVRIEEGILQPSLNVRGIASGRVGAEAANAVPTQATASIDFRLVPDQRPETVRAKVEAHLRAQGYTVVTESPDLEARRAQPRLARVQWGTGYPAARTRLDEPASRAVVRAIEEALGSPIVKVPTLGGSVPMHLFQEVVGVPVVGVPIVNHDNNQHAANENLRLRNLWDGIQVFAGLLARLDQAWPKPESSR